MRNMVEPQDFVTSFALKYLGKPDPLVEHWTFFNSTKYIPSILSVYFLVLHYGTRFMEKKAPFELRKLLILYNTGQVIISAHICKEVLVSAYLSDYKFKCSVIDRKNNVLALRMASAFWYFYLTKIFDLCDTVFFILRKKHNQLTFLHVYHHSTMIINWFLGVRYLPGGQTFFCVLLNSFVHVVMYTYYMLAAVGPHMQKYLKWKKYLTQVQLTQFLLCLIHLFYGLYNNCQAPLWLNIFTISYLCSMVMLFLNFYSRAYVPRKCKFSE